MSAAADASVAAAMDVDLYHAPTTHKSAGKRLPTTKSAKENEFTIAVHPVRRNPM